MTDAHDGVDPVALTRWLAAQVPRVELGDGPVAVERISGGHSNLTFRVTDAGGTPYALRRPPTGGVLATAHDMGREWRFLTALAGTAVPVPEPVALCSDPAVLGAGFYLMGWVDGVVRGTAPRVRPSPSRSGGPAVSTPPRYSRRCTPSTRPRWGSATWRGPAATWNGSCAAGTGRRTRARSPTSPRSTPRTPRWSRRCRRSRPAGRGSRTATSGRGTCRSAAAASPASSTGSSRRWGEPLADLGWLLASWERPGDTLPAITSGPTAAPGWPDRDLVAARYAERSGRALDQLPYWVAFAHWRCACIGAGVWTRYAQGNMGAGAESGEALERRRERVVADAEAALVAVRRRPTDRSRGA
nr:phosphotransferase [Pseudonocardia sp. ICBG1293]